MKSKTRAQRIFHTNNARKKKKKRSVALQSILEIKVIDLPQDIHHVFQTCKDNPSHFWRVYDAHVETCRDVGESIETFAIESYLVIRRLGLRRLLDTVLWRFYTTLFYDLALLLGNGQVHMSDPLYKQLLITLSRSPRITDEALVVEENLRSWVAAGSRYHKICLRLGRGALFLLPQLPDKV